MFNLPDTTSFVQLVTGVGATDVEVHVSYIDLTGDTAQNSTMVPGAQSTVISAPGTYTICDAPGSDASRNVKFMSVQNPGAACSVTFQSVIDSAGSAKEPTPNGRCCFCGRDSGIPILADSCRSVLAGQRAPGQPEIVVASPKHCER